MAKTQLFYRRTPHVYLLLLHHLGVKNIVLQHVYLLLLNDYGGKIVVLQHGARIGCVTHLLAGLLPR